MEKRSTLSLFILGNDEFFAAKTFSGRYQALFFVNRRLFYKISQKLTAKGFPKGKIDRHQKHRLLVILAADEDVVVMFI